VATDLQGSEHGNKEFLFVFLPISYHVSSSQPELHC